MKQFTQISNIYLGGDFSSDWRQSIVSNLQLPEDFELDPYENFETTSWPIKSHAIMDVFNYSGPYDLTEAYAQFLEDIPNEAARHEQAELEGYFNRMAIRHSDLVFAWIESEPSPRTIFELGYAAGLGKKVLISGPIPFQKYNLFSHFDFLIEQIRERDNYSVRFTPLLALKDYLYGYYQNETWEADMLNPLELSFMFAYNNSFNTFAGKVEQGVALASQFEIRCEKRYRVDFANFESKTVVEIDGLEAHKSTDQIANDRRRQREIEAEGWRFIRFGGKEIYNQLDACISETIAFIKKGLKP